MSVSNTIIEVIITKHLVILCKVIIAIASTEVHHQNFRPKGKKMFYKHLPKAAMCYVCVIILINKIHKTSMQNPLFSCDHFKGVLHPRPVFGLFLYFSQKLQHIGNK